METRRERGYLCVFPKTNPEPYVLRLEEYDSLLAAWQAGETFFNSTDAWGGRCCLKLADIVCVGESTADVITRKRAEDIELKSRDMVDGATSD